MPVITGQNVTRQLSEALRQRESTLARPLNAPVTDLREHDRCTWLGEPIEDVLAERRSVRAFASLAITRADVLGAIGAARNAEEAVWPHSRHGDIGLVMLIAAFDVDGLAKGLYRTDEASTELPSLDSAYLDILREQYADAPVLMLICADMNKACRDAGQAGYPAALTRAGTAGYAAWLWSISAGLAGSVYGGASQHASAAGRQWDANLRHLFTVAIGMPVGAVGARAEGGPRSSPSTHL
jgi:hypothetical protein